MTRYLLDTNVLSELRKPRPELRVLAFVAEQPLEALYVSTVTLAEIRFSIERAPTPAGARNWARGSRTRCDPCSSNACCPCQKT